MSAIPDTALFCSEYSQILTITRHLVQSPQTDIRQQLTEFEQTRSCRIPAVLKQYYALSGVQKNVYQHADHRILDVTELEVCRKEEYGEYLLFADSGYYTDLYCKMHNRFRAEISADKEQTARWAVAHRGFATQL